MIFSGLDLGAAKNFSALACVDRLPLAQPSPRRRWRYEVRHLRTWELGTSYVTIAADVGKLYASPQLAGSVLVPDYTGVGRPVFDQLKANRVRARMVPVLTTSGKLAHEEHGVWHVPKIDLVSTLQVLLQAELVKIGKSLPLADRLKRELQEFRVTITKSRNETFGADASQQDDLCIPAGVPVLTARGWVGIEQVTTADEVLTREGWKRVDWAGMTSPSADTIALDCGDAGFVECTLRHPVFVLNRGWVPAEEVRAGDEVLTCRQWSKRSSGADGFGVGIRSPKGATTVCTTSATPNGRTLPSGFTARCGGRRMATSPPDTTSTTATRTRSTTTSGTWSASRLPNTAGGTSPSTARPSDSPTCGGSSPAAKRHWPSGERLQKGLPSFGSEGLRPPPGWSPEPWCVSGVGLSSPPKLTGLNTAHSRADSKRESTRHSTAAPASGAGSNSWHTSEPSDFAPGRVRRTLESRRSVPVFNLTVADCPEFFAGGVLVHNCFATMLACWLGERDGGGLASGIGTPAPGRGNAVETAPDGVYAT